MWKRDVSLGPMYGQAGGVNSKEIQRDLAAVCCNSLFVSKHVAAEAGHEFITPISTEMQM